MAGRIVAVGILVVTLGIVGAFMAAALLGPRDEPAIATPGAGVGTATAADHSFTGTLGAWRLDGQLAVAQTGAYQLTLELTDEVGQPAPAFLPPTVQVDMVDHPMGTALPSVEPSGPGTYVAAGTLDMQGRWRFRIALGEATTDVVVDVRR